MTGTIVVCDVEDPGVSFVEVPEHTSVNFNYLNDICYTVFAGEDMLMVRRYYIDEEEPQVLTVRFLISKMNWNAHKWEEIQTLGEHSVFIGKNSS
ncbi:F-box protein SKIP23-like, partial [Trifolium medium]|nr:F-box protein SKIP23-like [Trifolium medium]